MARIKDTEREQARARGGDQAVKDLGELHGVPVSIKDTINLKGFLTTYGCAFLCAEEYRAKENAVVVSLYLRAGAIPIIRGNVPQSAMSMHTKNLIFGEARNPLDQTRSCGGSSGGEAGLIAARCVPIGIGSDIGGSIRFPASFCGIYGLKPTVTRVAFRGHPKAAKVQFSIPGHLQAVIGPLGGTVEDLVLQSKVLFAHDVHLYEPLRSPLPYKQEDMDYVMDKQNFKKIKVGMLDYSSFMGVSESVKRAMKMTEQALKNIGYDVVPVKFD